MEARRAGLLLASSAGAGQTGVSHILCEASQVGDAAAARGPAADVSGSADPVDVIMQQYEDAIQLERLGQRAEHLGLTDVDPREDQSSQGAEEQQHGSNHGRTDSDMMARISVCPQRPRRHVFEKRLDGAARLAASHLRSNVTLPLEFDAIADLQPVLDATEH